MDNVRLGPEGYEGIAVVGSAPSSVLLAPYDDPRWAIWGTSPSSWAQMAGRRSDVWFELHRFLPYPPGKVNEPGTRNFFSPEFRQFLREYPGTVLMTEKHADIPHCVEYPYQEMLEKHGPYHFCSTVSWMLALAIDRLMDLDLGTIKPKLGVFGIDMAAGSEWAYQRPACQHFLGLAVALGIEVVLPPESDLMRPSTLYGIGEHSARHVRIAERLKELEAQERQGQQAIQQMNLDLAKLAGAKEAYNYFLEVWCDDLDPDLSQAQSFSGMFK